LGARDATPWAVADKQEKGRGEVNWRDCVNRRKHPVTGEEFWLGWQAMGRIYDQLEESIRRGFFLEEAVRGDKGQVRLKEECPFIEQDKFDKKYGVTIPSLHAKKIDNCTLKDPRICSRVHLGAQQQGAGVRGRGRCALCPLAGGATLAVPPSRGRRQKQGAGVRGRGSCVLCPLAGGAALAVPPSRGSWQVFRCVCVCGVWGLGFSVELVQFTTAVLPRRGRHLSCAP